MEKELNSLNIMIVEDVMKYVDISGSPKNALAIVAMMLEYLAVLLDIDILDLYDKLRYLASDVKGELGDMRDAFDMKEE